MNDVTNVQKDNAKRMLLSMAAYASESADKFSNWLAIGFSAVFSIIIGNIDKLKNYLDVGNTKLIALIYISVLLIVLIQKRIFFSVQAAHRGDSIARDILATDADAFNPDFTTDQLVKSTLWIMKGYLEKRLSIVKVKTAAGDPLWNARTLAKWAQWQQWLVVAQAAINIYAAYLLAASIDA